MDTSNTQQGTPPSTQTKSNMKSENRILQWFKNNWFLWVILIVAYVVIRLAGYDLKVEKAENSGYKDTRPKVEY